MVYTKTESVRENKTHKLIWNFLMQTDQLISVRRSDRPKINQEDKTCCNIGPTCLKKEVHRK